MTHPGLPWPWVLAAAILMAALTAQLLWRLPPMHTANSRNRSFTRPLRISPQWQTLLRLVFAAIFVLVISAGLFGSAIPERNFATTITWSLWWTGVIISVFFVGSAWCGVCPWDSLATWLVRRRLWKRNDDGGLNLRVPERLRTVWPATAMLILLTWLELGFGVTRSPYATAVLSLLMLSLATVSLALFERKAMCRYFCPVGRTIGAYSQLGLAEMRPIEQSRCDNCATLECYHGSDDIEPCPTRLVMGRLKQNTYCTSCGACLRSCPHDNVAWGLRPPATEIKEHARPHRDEAWFMLLLLALTSFHGLTMLPFWETWMSSLARVLADSGQLLRSFSIGMLLVMVVFALLYALAVQGTRLLLPAATNYRALFNRAAFVTLPLAFAYHLAHNLNHLSREGVGLGAVWLNPLGRGMQPPGMQELHLRHMNPLLPDTLLFALQSGLMVLGFYFALQVMRYRLPVDGETQSRLRHGALLPMLLFSIIITSLNLWMMMQPMVMRL